MYNIYIAEKRKKDLEEKEKIRKTFAKYRNKFKSKKINIFIKIHNINISNYRTNSNNV